MSKQHRTAIIVGHEYFPRSGAASQRLGAIASELARRNIHAAVFTTGEGASSTTTIGPAGETITSSAPPRYLRRHRIARLTWMLGTAALAVIRTRPTHLITDPPPIVSYPLLALAQRLNIRSLFYFADSWAGIAKTSDNWRLRALAPLFSTLEQQSIRKATVTATVTPSLAQTADQHSDHTIYVPNRVDLNIYNPEGPAWEAKRPFPRRFFAYTGNMGYVHGAHIFYDAAQQLWAEGLDFGLVFVGFGIEFESLSERTASSSEPVICMPRQDPQTVASILRSSLGALVSLRPVPAYADAVPTKTLAALGTGSPPIYAGEGDFAEKLDGASVGFVGEWSIPAAASLMRAALAESAEEHRARRIRCRAWVRDQMQSHAGPAEVTQSLLDHEDVPFSEPSTTILEVEN